jgi:hypothetical protein
MENFKGSVSRTRLRLPRLMLAANKIKAFGEPSTFTTL